MSKVIEFPLNKKTSEKIFEEMKDRKFKHVIVLGVTEDNSLHTNTNFDTMSEVLACLEITKRDVIEVIAGDDNWNKI